MTDLIERWRAQMARPHVIIHELRNIGTGLADENERLQSAIIPLVNRMRSFEKMYGDEADADDPIEVPLRELRALIGSKMKG